MIREEDLFLIGRLGKLHGVKGEITLFTHPLDARISNLREQNWGARISNPRELECVVCSIDGIWTPFFVASCRQKNATTTLVAFDNLDTAEKVKFLTGKDAFVPSKFLPPPDATISKDEAQSEESVIGYTVIDKQLGLLGEIIYIDDRTMNTLLAVDYNSKELLIPFAFVKVVANHEKTINVSLPDGFLDII